MAEYSVIEIMSEASLAGLATIPTAISGEECEVFNTGDIDDLSISVSALFGTAATGDIELHVVTSPTGEAEDATKWDTEDYVLGVLTCVAETRVQKTFVVEADPHFMTCYVVNLDAVVAAEEIVVTKVTTRK